MCGGFGVYPLKELIESKSSESSLIFLKNRFVQNFCLVMNGSVCKSVLCDPKQHLSELWLPEADSNVGCERKRKLCERHANVMKSSTKSEIDISSFDKEQNQRRCQTAKAETKPTCTVCRQESVDLLKSKSLGFVSKKSSGNCVNKSTDPKVKSDPIFLFQLR